VADPLRVGIVGGSLGGLTAALLLRDLGYRVDVFERSTAELEARGAGIVVMPETSRYLRERTDVDIDDVTTSTSWMRYLDERGLVVYEERYPCLYSGWHTLYRALLERFGRERYHLGRGVSGFDANDDEVQLTFEDGSNDVFDLVVCADGIASRSRMRLVPQSKPVYSGYVAWRGTVAEDHLSAHVLEPFADALVYQVMPSSHILVYPIPNIDGATQPGRQMLNFVWYRNYSQGHELEDLMTDVTGVRRETTMPPGSVHVDQLEAIRDQARSLLAPSIAEVVLTTERPFVQVISDLDVPRMAFGRVCLIGDAAFAVRPHIAAGTAKAASDAWALADELEAAGGDVLDALQVWEKRQLAVGKAALERARRSGRRSQFEGTWVPGDPDMAYGLR
jgi:2,6-dihydroxypyridine 3-monooxygenase